MTKKEVETIRNELFEDEYNRNRERIEKLTAEIKPAEAEASYPESVRLRLEEQRQSLRDILIEGNNLLPWREATTDLDELRKALSIYAAKRNSKNPGDETAGYAWDIARKIQRYRDLEDLLEIEKTAATGNNESGADKPPEAGTETREETAFKEYIRGSGRIEEDVSENGKYNLFGKAEDFVRWYIYNNYEASESFSFLPGYMDKYLNHGCTTETLKRYVRRYKKDVPGQLETEKSMEILRKMHNPHKSGTNPA